MFAIIKATRYPPLKPRYNVINNGDGMITTDEMHEMIEEECVRLEYVDLPGGLQGSQCYSNGKKVILINKQIITNERLYRTVLSEELGHYFTTYGEHASKRKLNHRFRVRYEKIEQMAVRWGADYLIPIHEMLEAITGMHPPTLCELAKTFEVMESLVQMKLQNMAAIKHTWSLPGGKRLVLTNLPDVYLYEAF